MRFNVNVVCSCMLTYGWRSSLTPSPLCIPCVGFCTMVLVRMSALGQ
jgi:hypothetical protein